MKKKKTANETSHQKSWIIDFIQAQELKALIRQNHNQNIKNQKTHAKQTLSKDENKNEAQINTIENPKNQKCLID